MFTENLHNVFQDIYRLVKYVGFSGEYVESIAPVERGLYLMYFDKEQEELRKQQEVLEGYKQGPTIGQPFDAQGNIE